MIQYYIYWLLFEAADFIAYWILEAMYTQEGHTNLEFQDLCFIYSASIKLKSGGGGEYDARKSQKGLISTSGSGQKSYKCLILEILAVGKAPLPPLPII